jgi:outer membrane protein assembly factor BamB
MYTSTQVLRNGQVLVRHSDYAANQTEFQVLDARNGHMIWQRMTTGLDAFITEDASGHLCEQGPSTLQRLGPLGETLWTFVIPAALGHMPRIGRIQSAGDEWLVTLFEAEGKYPRATLAALDWNTGTVKWIYEADQPLALISYSEPDWIIIGTMLSGRSIALYR